MNSKKILQKIKEFAKMQFFAFLLRFLLKVIRKYQLKKNSTEDKRVCIHAIFGILIKIFIISYTKISTQKKFYKS